MNVVVRKYEDNDSSQVDKIILDNFGGELVRDKIADYIDQYVAVENGKVIGYFVTTKILNVIRGYYYYLIDYVCVDKDNQGKGIGKVMMNFIIERAKTEGIRYIQLTSSDKRIFARKLYTSVGFVKYDTNIFRLVI